MRLIKQMLPVMFLAGVAMLGACKKEKAIENPNPNPNPGTVSQADKLKDSALLYSREVYLWNDQIPASFNARNFADPDKIMGAIRPFSKETGFTEAVDRWSFAIDQSTWDDVSSGVAQDFGMSVFFLSEGDLRVKLVEKTSPSGVAGIKRGWQIIKMNGNSNMTTTNADFIVQNVWGSNSTSFTFKKPDGSLVDLTLNAATYQENPIFLDTVYSTGNKKVGYLVFNSFLGDTTQIYGDFNRIFNRFEQEGVNEMIIDLRYNGGGYVDIQTRLANYLANAAANGNVMFKTEYNNILAQYNSTKRFQKMGSLELSRIFFVVSSSTASASELLINNLKPYMDVKIVGPNASYGKPVGYFPIPVGSWYIFPVSSRTVNKEGIGNYFKGFAPDKQVADGLNKDWGDVDEAGLASIVKYIGTGSFGAMNEIPGSKVGSGFKESRVIESNRKLDMNEFKGAIETRKF